MLTLSLYKQYQEYRRCLRDSDTELSYFMQYFENHILKLEEIIYDQCTVIELKMLNFLLSCNLPDEDIERVLDFCTGMVSDKGNDSKKIIQTLSSFLTKTFKFDNKEDDLSMKRQVVVVRILKAKKKEAEEEYNFISNDYYPQSSEDESGNSQLKLEDIVGQDTNDSNNLREEKILKKKAKIVPRVQCDLCDKSFPRGRLKVHLRRVHSDTRVPCPHCGKMIPEYRMSEHIKRHSEVFKCQD